MYIYERKTNKIKMKLLVSLLILMLMGGFFFYSQKNDTKMVGLFKSEDEVRLQLPSIEYEEVIMLPYNVNATTVTYFYDKEKDKSILENAIVEFEGVYRPSQGVDYFFEDKVFEVMAMLSGKVVEVKDDNLMGKSVTVESDGLSLTYQSLSKVNVQVGQDVLQSTSIGLAGENLYNHSLGIHLHIVAEKDGQLVDPEMLIGKKRSELK